jgi:hypothetical protein
MLALNTTTSVESKFVSLLLPVGLFMGLISTYLGVGRAQSGDTTYQSLRALTPSVTMTGEEIVVKVVEHNRARESDLRKYSTIRTYRAASPQGKLYAEQVVRMEYRAPDSKVFTTVRENGSSILRNQVFKPLMNSEAETSAGRSRESSAITPANYRFQVVGREDSTVCQCFVVEAKPARMEKYLFVGTIWIDDRDFAIVKIVGHPVKSPSFWIKHAEFVRTYQKIGQFWLPLKDRTEVEMKIFGEKILTVDYGEYAITPGPSLGP